MNILKSVEEMKAWADKVHSQGHKLALVPTMGFLHAGHLSLVREAQERCTKVVVSLFVNPTQFAPGEDLTTYPNDLDGDLEKLKSMGVDAVFMPTPDTVYPDGFDTFIAPDKLGQDLCGPSRPIHFRGVCTVVAILFRVTRCDSAVFGQKDYQQLQIIKRMNRDLHLGVDVIGMPIIRENDGLAMSSRNAYLSATERQQALCLSQSLEWAQRRVKDGERDVETLSNGIRQQIQAHPLASIDYVKLVDAETLEPVRDLEKPILCALAVHLGNTRLIDNLVLTPLPAA
jgi:pantoate--beta-alanine ligase